MQHPIMNRCEHSVYDPAKDQRYCTVCNPPTVKGEIIKKIKTAVGVLTLVTDLTPVLKSEWSDKLDSCGLTMDRGAKPQDIVAIFEYHDRADLAPASDLDLRLADGFAIMNRDGDDFGDEATFEEIEDEDDIDD